MKKEEIVEMTMPKRFRIWDNLHKRWFQGRTDDKSRNLGTDAIYFFGEIMAMGEVFHDQNEDDAWSEISYLEMLNHLVCVQSTGLFDKNGKEIFEGDILEGFDEEKIIVEYDSGSFYGRELSEKRFLLYSHWFADQCHKWNYEVPELIGNIFENPELLEDE